MTGSGDHTPVVRSNEATPAELAAMDRTFVSAALGPAYGPNPQVGCVLLSAEGEVLAEGWHRGAGTPHAEAAAIDAARAAGGDLAGAVAVVTLEPCNHTGRTGPCTDLLLEAGVSRVVYAVDDPDPTAAGGAARLRAAGVDVRGGVCAEQGEALLRIWLHALRTGRPFVTLKLATTLDGRVAAADGSSRWITSREAREHAHALRARVDAIAVGTGTVLADDPALSARAPDGSLRPHQPLRVVVGSRDVPAGSRVRGPGGELFQARTRVPSDVLRDLVPLGVRHLLVEGGPTVATAFLRAGLVDRVHAYVAPALLGSGRTVVGDLGVTAIDSAIRLETRTVEQLGPDVLIVAEPLRETT